MAQIQKISKETVATLSLDPIIRKAVEAMRPYMLVGQTLDPDLAVVQGMFGVKLRHGLELTFTTKSTGKARCEDGTDYSLEVTTMYLTVRETNGTLAESVKALTKSLETAENVEEALTPYLNLPVAYLYLWPILTDPTL